MGDGATHRIKRGCNLFVIFKLLRNWDWKLYICRSDLDLRIKTWSQT